MKELLKSVHVRQSYHKKTAWVFLTHDIDLFNTWSVYAFRIVWNTRMWRISLQLFKSTFIDTWVLGNVRLGGSKEFAVLLTTNATRCKTKARDSKARANANALGGKAKVKAKAKAPGCKAKAKVEVKDLSFKAKACKAKNFGLKAKAKAEA